MTETTMRRVKADTYGVTPVEPAVPMFYAFLDPSDLVACIYSSAGEWIEDRGSLAITGNVPNRDNGLCIPIDSGEKVGVGALAWRTADDEITVWDVEGSASYAYSASLGVQVSAPVYRDGWVYWFEVPAGWTASTATTWIRRARADLTDVETVATIVGITDGLEVADFDGAIWIVAQTDHILVAAGYSDAEVQGTFYVRCTWDGTSYTTDFNGGDVGGVGALGLVLGFADGFGEAVGWDLYGTPAALRSCVDSLTAPAEDRWPTTGDWAQVSTYNISVAQDGSLAAIYGDNGTNTFAIVAPSTATGGSPTARVFTQNHPVHLFPPVWLYLME